jgi:hypothetical protein
MKSLRKANPEQKILVQKSLLRKKVRAKPKLAHQKRVKKLHRHLLKDKNRFIIILNNKYNKTKGL